MLVERVKALVDEVGSLELAAAALSVRPSTLRKVLVGRPLSGPALAKLRHALNAPPDASDFAKAKERLQGRVRLEEARLRGIYELYRQLGTLEAVGRQVGLTRERVRQLLVRGMKFGLFKYQPREYPYIAKDKLLADYRASLSRDKVAKINSVPTPYVNKLLTAYRVRRNELRAIAKEGRKDRCIEEYLAMTSQLNHHPTTTELQSTSKGHSLNARILRLWGSTDAFREALNIPAPAQGSPTFRRDVAPWIEEKKRIALIVRLQQLDDIRDFLREARRPQSLRKIAARCGLKLPRATILIGLLRGAREIERVGDGIFTQYQLKGADR